MVLLLIGHISASTMSHGRVHGCLLLNDCYICLHHVPGVPLSTPAVWKDIFRDNVTLKRNWADGRCRVTDMAGHTHK